jgi:hypothetical protein
MNIIRLLGGSRCLPSLFGELQRYVHAALLQRMVRRICTAAGQFERSTTLLPGEKAEFSLVATLPEQLPPSFVGTAARFDYYVSITCRATFSELLESQTDENIVRDSRSCNSCQCIADQAASSCMSVESKTCSTMMRQDSACDDALFKVAILQQAMHTAKLQLACRPIAVPKLRRALH